MYFISYKLKIIYLRVVATVKNGLNNALNRLSPTAVTLLGRRKGL